MSLALCASISIFSLACPLTASYNTRGAFLLLSLGRCSHVEGIETYQEGPLLSVLKSLRVRGVEVDVERL